MKFKHNWELSSTNDLQEIFEDGNKELSDIIVDIALSNVKTKIKTIPVITISTKDTDLIYDVIIGREDLIETLEVNLETMINYEDYNRCTKIQKALVYLKK
jgi:hypothetical protein